MCCNYQITEDSIKISKINITLLNIKNKDMADFYEYSMPKVIRLLGS